MKKQLAATALISLIVFTSLASAKDRAAITVKDVTFKRTSSSWITADVEFQAGDFVTSTKDRKKDYLERVKLTLTAAYEDRDLANSRNATAEQKQNLRVLPARGRTDRRQTLKNHYHPLLHPAGRRRKQGVQGQADRMDSRLGSRGSSDACRREALPRQLL